MSLDPNARRNVIEAAILGAVTILACCAVGAVFPYLPHWGP